MRVLAALAAVAAAHGLVLPAPRTPVHLRPRVAVLQHRPLLLRAALVASSEAQPPSERSGAGGASVELEGKLVSAGSDVICADEYGSWWMASVVDVRRAGGDVDILVHYKGCEPAMDEWLEAASGRVSPQPPMAPQLSDETWRDVGDGLDPVEDADLLAELRAERQAVVDQWQYNTFCAAHIGEWAGVATRYTVRQGGPSQPSLEQTDTFGVRSSVRADGDRADSRTLAFSEAPRPGDALERRSALTLSPSDMRAEQGHMAVGSGYTLTLRPTPGEQMELPGSTPLIVEIALSHNAEQPPGGSAQGPAQRVRCTVGYSPFQDGDEAAAQARRVEWVEVAREMAVPVGSTAPADARELPPTATALLGVAGTGLYDYDAQRAGGGLYSLYCEGGVTLVLPIELRSGAPAALSLDWNAGQMRYQADRKFDGAHDGTLLTLELTEAAGS